MKDEFEDEEKLSLRQKWFPYLTEIDEGVSVGQFFLRWTRTIALGGLLIWGGCQTIGNSIQYGEGVRTGMVNKLSKKGLFWKTYEGQMALEGIVSGKNYSGANVWDFSLDRQANHGEDTNALATKLIDYTRSGTKVTVKYAQPLTAWPWRAGTRYLVQSVEAVK